MAKAGTNRTIAAGGRLVVKKERAIASGDKQIRRSSSTYAFSIASPIDPPWQQKAKAELDALYDESCPPESSSVHSVGS